MQVIRRLPVLGRLRLLAIVVTIAGLMTPSFPTSGPGESKPSTSSELAWNPVDTPFDPFVEGEEFPAEPIEDEPTEAPAPDEEDSIDFNESAIGLYVSGARRSVLRPDSRMAPAQPRDPFKASIQSRSEQGDRVLTLDLPIRLCRLTC